MKFSDLSEDDKIECKFEIVDMLHFFMNYAASIGMTPAEMYLYWAIHLQRVNQQKDSEQGGRSSNTSMFNGEHTQI